MDHTLIPPESRVRTGELGDELTMRIVANIGQTVDTLTLRQLISGDQLGVSMGSPAPMSLRSAAERSWLSTRSWESSSPGSSG